MTSFMQWFKKGLAEGGLTTQDAAVMIASPLLVLVAMGCLVKIIQINVIGVFEPYELKLPTNQTAQYLVIEKTPWYDEEAVMRSYKAKAIF